MLHSECNKLVPFFLSLVFSRAPLLSSIERSAPPPSLKSLATPLKDRQLKTTTTTLFLISDKGKLKNNIRDLKTATAKLLYRITGIPNVDCRRISLSTRWHSETGCLRQRVIRGVLVGRRAIPLTRLALHRRPIRIYD